MEKVRKHRAATMAKYKKKQKKTDVKKRSKTRGERVREPIRTTAPPPRAPPRRQDSRPMIIDAPIRGGSSGDMTPADVTRDYGKKTGKGKK